MTILYAQSDKYPTPDLNHATTFPPPSLTYFHTPCPLHSQPSPLSQQCQINHPSSAQFHSSYSRTLHMRPLSSTPSALPPSSSPFSRPANTYTPPSLSKLVRTYMPESSAPDSTTGPRPAALATKPPSLKTLQSNTKGIARPSSASVVATFAQISFKTTSGSPSTGMNAT